MCPGRSLVYLTGLRGWRASHGLSFVRADNPNEVMVDGRPSYLEVRTIAFRAGSHHRIERIRKLSGRFGVSPEKSVVAARVVPAFLSTSQPGPR